MAASHGSKAKLLIDGYDVSGYFQSVAAPMTVDTADTSGFGDTAKEYVLGLEDAQLTAEGTWDGAAAAIDAILAAILGAAAQKIFSYFPAGDALGARALGISADLAAYDVVAAIGDAARLTLAAQSSVGIESGVCLHALGAETTPDVSASVNNGASSTNGGSGYVQATAATGSATIKVAHSTNDSVWADLITFTAITGRASERKTVTGTVNQYLRSDWVPGTTVTFAVHFHRKPNA